MDSDLEPVFRVYGDKNILNKMVINIDLIRYGKNYPAYTDSKTQTLLYKGDQLSFQSESVDSYKIYFSYEDKVGELSFENVYRQLNGTSDRINDIYVTETDEGLYLTHYGTKSYLTKKQGFKSGIYTSLNKFFDKYPDLNEADKIILKDKFYEFYEPKNRHFRRDPITQETITFFKKLPLEQKKTYGVFPEDIKKMDLPEVELRELLEYMKKHPVNE